MTPHEELEKKIAEFKGTEAALLFPTGYMANLGALCALTGKGDVVIGDKLNHASIIDGCRQSGATFRVYPHNDVSHLETLLKRHASFRRRLIVTDSVFSMDGDYAAAGNRGGCQAIRRPHYGGRRARPGCLRPTGEGHDRTLRPSREDRYYYGFHEQGAGKHRRVYRRG